MSLEGQFPSGRLERHFPLSVIVIRGIVAGASLVLDVLAVFFARSRYWPAGTGKVTLRDVSQ